MISGPAIRRSAICAGSRSTRSRSTNPSCRDFSSNADSLAIVKAVIGLGHSLGMTTTAEGVETEAQLRMIREQGCTEVQGFLFSLPLPGAAVGELLSRFGSAGTGKAMRSSDVA